MVESPKPGRAQATDERPRALTLSAQMTSKRAHTFTLILLLATLAAAVGLHRAAHAQRKPAARAARTALVFLDSTRERDGLRGPVRRVRAEVARLFARGGGRSMEGPRRLLEVTVYDPAGRRISNETYPVVSGLAGQESNTFDAQGNLAETIVRDSRGEVLSRTTYTYEFDRQGNWTKMVAALTVKRPEGPAALEPVEVTYRAITYYTQGASGAGGASSAAAAATPSPTPATTPSALASGDVRSAATNSPTSGAGEDISSLPDAGLLNGKASSLPPPAYPVGGSRSGRGLILIAVEVVIDETGRVTSARAPSGSKELREAAETAALRAVFAPFLDGGVPRKVRGTIRYTFPYASAP